jgi:hypothetical protein
MNSKPKSSLTETDLEKFKASPLYARWLVTRQLGLARDNPRLQKCLLEGYLVIFAATCTEDEATPGDGMGLVS